MILADAFHKCIKCPFTDVGSKVTNREEILHGYQCVSPLNIQIRARSDISCKIDPEVLKARLSSVHYQFEYVIMLYHENLAKHVGCYMQSFRGIDFRENKHCFFFYCRSTLYCSNIPV